jgi:quinol monooxygenase YgiN
MLRFDVLEDPESDAIYVLEAYRSRAAFDEHKEGDLFQEWDSQIKPTLKLFEILYEG